MTHKEFSRRVKMMDKVILIKRDLKILLPNVEQYKFLYMFSHLSGIHPNGKQYWSRNIRKKTKKPKNLTEEEKILLDYMLQNELNPKTTYKWFLVSKMPEDIQDRLRNNQIKSVTEARKIAMNRKRVRQSNTGLMMLDEIKNIIESL